MRFHQPIKVLAVRDRNESALERAASGGAFSVLARPVISDGGIVFGARMKDGGAVSHVGATSLDELEALQGSAYVQSDISGVYEPLAEAVGAGRRAMFVGTPCQCAAVVSYLRAKHIFIELEDRENLIVCDLICHGAPNSELLRAHQQWLSRRVGADDGIHSFAFRTKRMGWGLYYYYYYYKNGAKHEVCDAGDSDPYYGAFLRGETYRECCYKCPFARRERATDFTIGDYWGIESAHQDFYDSRGVSVVLVNTDKGLAFFDDRASVGCDWIESNLDSAARDNHNLNAPTARPSSRDDLLRAIAHRRADGNMDALFDVDLRPKMSLKRVVKKLLPSPMVSRLKKMAGMVRK